MLLSDDKELFERAINNTALHFSILREYVEKDYWLVSLLKNIFQSGNEYVFKGGTSLSKCFKLIYRFSEDIDISYKQPYEELGPSPKDRLFKGISKNILKSGLSISNKESLRRDRYFNRFICPYPTILGKTSIDTKIIIELAGQTPSFPSETKKIQTFIGEYFESINRSDLVAQYGLEAFDITVQSLSRTFVDKTFALCDYFLSGKSEKRSRHIYDLNKITKQIKLDKELVSIFNEVKDYRKNSSVCLSAHGDRKLHIILKQIIEQKFFYEDYTAYTYVLLYEKVSYEQCEETLLEIYNFLKEYNL